MTTPTPTQASSNTVLFEMMMHYKTSMENAEKREKEQKLKDSKRVHAARMQYLTARDEAARLQAENHEMIQVARMMGRSMRRKTAIQHHRDHLIDQLTTNIDDLFDAIDLVVDTNLEHSLGVDYISMHKNAIRQRIVCAAETCNQRVAVWNVSDEELAADEVIDLAGDTTEEDEESEEETEEERIEREETDNDPINIEHAARYSAWMMQQDAGTDMTGAIWDRDLNDWVPLNRE